MMNTKDDQGVDFYDWLLMQTASDQVIESVQIGLIWTVCKTHQNLGLAMTPEVYSRTLSWSGSMVGKTLRQAAKGIRVWEPFEATVAMAAMNAAVKPDFSNFDEVIELPNDAENLAVFDYFLPRIQGARIVVIGRYPGLEAYEQRYDIAVIERNPGPNDYPEAAAETLIPDADWVFVTASSIINRTFPRLAELAEKASLVLMGPTTPWLPDMKQWGVDFLAGTVVKDEALLCSIIAEAGGKAIFDNAISYVIADIGKDRMLKVKDEIAFLAAQRDSLKEKMALWYETEKGRFPDLALLETVQSELSHLDSAYKQMWDVRRDIDSNGD